MIKEPEELEKLMKLAGEGGVAAAGGSSTKAFDPCLDAGEVGEGPVVEPLRLYLLKPLKESRLYWRPPNESKLYVI